MERMLSHLPTLCGAGAGLLVATGHGAAGAAMAALGILASYALRTQAWQTEDA
ncbi:hypothetical protein [Pseudothauera nasutitermitis]|uniref:hypothetical protein n=1 Tax=Pseudothauera nasutitermitis TaxID=2565930 RepID=UPI001454E2F3|nr:hypothetical protein [Pseudothauera nasutitermitis]